MPIQDIKNKIKIIGEKYNLKSVFLFGSMSRRTNRADSDIDLWTIKLYLKKYKNIVIC